MDAGHASRWLATMVDYAEEFAPGGFAMWQRDVRRTLSHLEWTRYRSRRTIEVKPIDHDGASYDPRTGQKRPFRKGSWRVKGSAEVIDGDEMTREWERLPDETTT